MDESAAALKEVEAAQHVWLDGLIAAMQVAWIAGLIIGVVLLLRTI